MAILADDSVAAIRERLADAGDPARAAPMQKYLKSDMPCRGVQLPAVRTVVRDVTRVHPIQDRSRWEATIRELYDTAEFREERYAAIAVSGQRPYAKWQDLAAMPLYQHMISTGAWWDLVDEVAIRRVGSIRRTLPSELAPIMLTWAQHDDIWLRRASIICQVTAKDATDPGLLQACIEPSISCTEFFLRKGIGWALRDFAKTDPGWVRTYVASHPGLSTLSRREAMKHLA